MHGSAVVAPAQDELPDFPYLSHMSNYAITGSSDREFDEYVFFDGKQMVSLEGKKYSKEYSVKENSPIASQLQILRNYGNAVKAAGGAVVHEGECGTGCEGKGGRFETLKMSKDGREIWVEIEPSADGQWYRLNAIERGEMKQDVGAKGQ
jgi:hypothetical protein